LRRAAWLLGAVLISIGWALPGAAQVQSLSREQAVQQLEMLKAQVAELQRSLEASRSRFHTEQAQLKATDLDIQSAAIKLREIEQDLASQRAHLAELQSQREGKLEDLSGRSDQLARQAAAAYRAGRESRLKLLLSQDSPARLGRLLAYYEYLNQAQAQRIGALREELAALDQLQATIDTTLQSLQADHVRQQTALASLQEQRDRRQALLDDIARQIEGDAERLEELQHNQSDLQALVERLTRALADIPSDLGQYQHPRTLKGRLPMPLTGRVRHAFGQVRSVGMRWQGWLIGADSGAEVHSIAYGRVAFADWLRGYGLLMIIDHGDGFMSLYGNNETLFFEPGDWVQPGAPIGTVGSNPGDEQGLYFELRSQGEAIDPAQWVKRG